MGRFSTANINKINHCQRLLYIALDNGLYKRKFGVTERLEWKNSLAPINENADLNPTQPLLVLIGNNYRVTWQIYLINNYH